MARITYILHDGTERTVEAEPGMTVMEAATLWDSVAVTATLLNAVGASDRQISAVPRCTFVLAARTHVSPAPETLFTVVFDPER